MSRAILKDLNYETLMDRLHKDHMKMTIGYVTIAVRNGDTIEILHHSSVIGKLDGNTVSVDDCGYQTVTTTHRINKILRDNNVGHCRLRDGCTEINGEKRSEATFIVEH